MSCYNLYCYLGEHPIAAFFLVLALGWAIANIIQAFRGQEAGPFFSIKSTNNKE